MFSKEKHAEMQQEALQGREEFRNNLIKMPRISPLKLLLIIGWSLAMSSFDLQIVNVSNPSVQKDSNFVPPGEEPIPQGTLQWCNAVFSIAFASFAIPAAKMGDRFGTTTVQRFGVVGFTICSIMCGLSKFISYKITPWKYGGFYILVIARACQGIFGAFNQANCMTMCGTLVEKELVSTAIGYQMLVGSIAGFCAPLVAGFLIDYLDWNYCYFINSGLGILAATLSFVYLPKMPTFKEPKVDWQGIIFVLFGLAVLVFGLTMAPPKMHASTTAIVCIICGVIAISMFVLWELWHPFAILPRILLSQKNLMLSFMAEICMYSVSMSITFQLPFVLQTIRGLTAFQFSIMSLVSPIGQMCSAFVANHLVKKYATLVWKLIAAASNILLAIFYSYETRGNWIIIVLCWCLFYFTSQIFMVGNNQFMMEIAVADIKGCIGGVIQMLRETGFALGTAVANMIHDTYMNSNWFSPIPDKNDDNFGEFTEVYLQDFFITEIIMACTLGVLGWFAAMFSGYGDHEKERGCYYVKKAKPSKAGYTEVDPLVQAENKPEDA